MGKKAKNIKPNNQGQALIEYMLVITFLIYISSRFASTISTEMGDQMGKLAHVVSFNLSVGVCPTKCLFGGYSNGHQ